MEIFKMDITNCEVDLVSINLRIKRQERNKFDAALALRGKKISEVLRQAIVKCIADTDNFLSYIFE
jgi:hypothetical protein